MQKDTDITLVGCSLYFLPVETRVPLKFGPEILTSVTCARVRMVAQKADGEIVIGWGETPLSVQWVWPSQVSYQQRHEMLKLFAIKLAKAWAEYSISGHALEIGHAFQKSVLPGLLKEHNSDSTLTESMPWLAALVCCSPFDIALHDAYGKAQQLPVYKTYNQDFLSNDLSVFIEPAVDTNVRFERLYPEDFLQSPPEELPVWHLVGGLDPINEEEFTGNEPDDGHPVLLEDWIAHDGLKCLKVKLRGTDYRWDYDRLVRVGEIAIRQNVDWLTADFNSTVLDPDYVNQILDHLVIENPRIYGMILYVEQPFPYDLEKHRIDVHSVSARKPLFMDESAHDWEIVRIGRSLGWTGVALKTCKTQTGALLTACWAKAHGMTLMVQDLTNPMLAQIPHVLLAAYSGTIMGVESNAMQFYPAASEIEARVHTGLYKRVGGKLNLKTVSGPGFGYRLDEISRILPEPVVEFGRVS